jgi:hypothetical protein
MSRKVTIGLLVLGVVMVIAGVVIVFVGLP